MSQLAVTNCVRDLPLDRYKREGATDGPPHHAAFNHRRREDSRMMYVATSIDSTAGLITERPRATSLSRR